MGLKMPIIPVNFKNVSHDAQWYTIVTKFNYEQKFVKDLYAGLSNMGMTDNIFEVVLPFKEIVTKVVDAKGKTKEKITVEKIMPLYVLVKACMTERVFYYLRNTAGCANIMAAGGSLLVMTEEEVQKIKQQCGLLEKEEEAKKQKNIQLLEKLKKDFAGKKGDRVKIIDGPFINYIGTIQSINFTKCKAAIILENGLSVEAELTALAI